MAINKKGKSGKIKKCPGRSVARKRTAKPAVPKTVVKEPRKKRVVIRTRSKIRQLPKYLREIIDKAIVEEKLTYQEISDLIQGFADEGKIQDQDVPKKSAVHRYAAKCLTTMEKVRLIETQARAMVSEVGGNSQALDEAVSKLAQSKLFDVLMGDVDNKRLCGLLVAAARLGQASAMRERVKLDISKKIKQRAERTADDVAGIARKHGVSKRLAKTFREKILGIADEK